MRSLFALMAGHPLGTIGEVRVRNEGLRERCFEGGECSLGFPLQEIPKHRAFTGKCGVTAAIPGDVQNPQKRGVLLTRFRKASRWTNDLCRLA